MFEFEKLCKEIPKYKDFEIIAIVFYGSKEINEPLFSVGSVKFAADRLFQFNEKLMTDILHKHLFRLIISVKGNTGYAGKFRQFRNGYFLVIFSIHQFEHRNSEAIPCYFVRFLVRKSENFLLFKFRLHFVPFSALHSCACL